MMKHRGPDTIRDLLETLPPAWLDGFTRHCDDQTQANALNWELDSTCGLEVTRIAELALYVASQWLDHAELVHQVACRQALTVCYG